MENNDKANNTSSHPVRTGKLILSSLKQNLDQPENGLDFYALGDGNGSWINILKQLHARGIIRVKPTEKLSFNDLIVQQEAFEAQVKSALYKYGINDYSTQIQLNQYPVEANDFDYINHFPEFLKKFEANTLNGQQIEVVLIGDLLGDRLTNNFAMLHFLDAFKDSIDFQIIYSNHDFTAMNFFHQLMHLVSNYERTHQGKPFLDATVDKVIFEPLLAHINEKIKKMSAPDASGKILTGVHFMYSSITWFYALKNQVHQKDSITPIKDFLNMLHSAYMPKVSLALARSFGDADEQDHAIFTHATCLLDSPKVSEMSETQISQMINLIASNDKNNGGSFVGSILEHYRNKRPEDQLLAISGNSLENLFAFVYARYIQFVRETIKPEKDQEDLLKMASDIHATYHGHLSVYRSRLNSDQTPRVTINAVLGIVNSLNAMMDLFREKNWLMYILCNPKILAFTQNRALYNNAFTKHVYSIHGHVGYISLSHYNSEKSNGVNLDSNGSFANRHHGGEHRVYAGTRFNNILSSNKLRTPLGSGVPVQETPAVQALNRARVEALRREQLKQQQNKAPEKKYKWKITPRTDGAKHSVSNGMFDSENRPNHSQASSSSSKRSIGEVVDTANNSDNKRPSNR